METPARTCSHARRFGAVVLLLPPLAWALLGGGCHEAPACYAGDFIGCRCDDGTPGYAPCDEGGDAFGACACDGIPGRGGGGGDSGGGSALAPLFASCVEDADCESGLCFQFNAKGPHCTVTCDGGCPAESPGCNQKGVCKTP